MAKMCYRCMTQTIQKNVCTTCGKPMIVRKADDTIPLPLGSRIDDGNVIVGDTLGRGGFGITYVALDKKLGKIALKEFVPRTLIRGRKNCVLQLDPEQTQMYDKMRRGFEKESRLLADLKHPNIVSVYFNGVNENNTVYYGMELLQGETLYKHIGKHGPYSPREACRILMPIMAALNFVHSKKTLHRDISPDNIFLQRDEASPDGFIPKLIDFGAAFTSMEDYTHTMPGVKKKGYSPMEQNWDEQHQGPWVDEYAFMATFYFMITGTIPPPADGEHRRADHDELKRPSEIRANISSAVDEVVLKGLAIDYRKRLQNMKEAAVALAKATECSNEYIASVRAKGHVSETPSEPDGTPPVNSSQIDNGWVRHEVPVSNIETAPRNRSGLHFVSLLIDWIIYGLPYLLGMMVNMPGMRLYIGGMSLGTTEFLIIGAVAVLIANMLLSAAPGGGTIGQRIIGLRANHSNAAFGSIVWYNIFRLLAPVALIDEIIGQGTADRLTMVENALGIYYEQGVCLRGVSGEVMGMVFKLRDENRIGRDAQWANIVIPNVDKHVSRMQCRIIRENDNWYILDEGHTGVTYINNIRVTSGARSAKLLEGDLISMGNQTFEFSIG